MKLKKNKYRIFLSQVIFVAYLLTITANIFHFHKVNLLPLHGFDEGKTADDFDSASYYELEYKCIFHLNYTSLNTIYFSVSNTCENCIDDSQTIINRQFAAPISLHVYKSIFHRGPPLLV